MVWLPADHRMIGREGHRVPYLMLAEGYAQAVKQCAQAQPLLFPLAEVAQIPALLDLVDGVLLTGSPSNVHPARFGEEVADPSLPLDPSRDALTLSLVHACIDRGVPLLGICRGFQEINVALGGSLLQQVQLVPGMMDHRDRDDDPMDVQYGPAHTVVLEAGSLLAQWAGGTQARVNSLHGQGVGRLAAGLHALGHAPDGLVEAFSIEGARNFALAVQWHPEWQCGENRLSSALFGAFGDACRERRSVRLTAGQNGIDNNQNHENTG